MNRASEAKRFFTDIPGIWTIQTTHEEEFLEIVQHLKNLPRVRPRIRWHFCYYAVVNPSHHTENSQCILRLWRQQKYVSFFYVMQCA
jgi:hypothetical protein